MASVLEYRSNRFTLRQEVKDPKDAFKFIASCDEIFGHEKCGKCGKANLHPRYRNPGGYDYFSLECQDCHAELKFGQAKETGRLFPKAWEDAHESRRSASEGRRESATVSEDSSDWN